MINVFVFHSFLSWKKPSPEVLLSYIREMRALAGKATNSFRVTPVMLPAECLPAVLMTFEELPFSPGVTDSIDSLFTKTCITGCLLE